MNRECILDAELPRRLTSSFKGEETGGRGSGAGGRGKERPRGPISVSLSGRARKINGLRRVAGETRRRGEKAKNWTEKPWELTFVLLASACLMLAGCGAKGAPDPAAGTPPPTKVETDNDASLVQVSRPDQFPLATATRRDAAPELSVTGVVAADVARNAPVISIASGRILEIHARLGDTVTKGQLLMKVQSNDLAQAFSDYRQAVADERLARSQLDRAQLLFDKGAIAQKDLEIASETEEKAKVTLETTAEHIRVLGADKDHPSSIVDVLAPASGVITDQQVTAASGTQGLASPNAFTISDLSHVWILCDVYENDLSFIHMNEYADIHVNAYPNIALKGRVGNIGAIMDPNIRSAKVRLEIENPGMLRLGMFVSATFHGAQSEPRALVPATAVLHLHDRDWVYMPAAENKFRRVEVTCGKMIASNSQEIVSGLKPGDRVVSNALVLQNTVEQ
jgi:membrane fusion protein, heavy metal efflux system